MRRLALLLGLALLVGGAGVTYALRAQQDRFPHDEHARLFPLCTGCHEGIATGNAARAFPAPQLCAGCHNGSDQARVNWTAPTRRVSNLSFAHPDHPGVPEGSLDCSTCHTRAGTNRMAVLRPVPERCFACHEHSATSHFVDARCQQCHVPLAQAAFTAARVRALPLPPSHQQPKFLEQLHGEIARTQRNQCVVCHTRERCAACHVNAATLSEVKAIPPAQGTLQLPLMNARYFVPASHQSSDWISRHGGATKNVADCTTCHTRESCLTCHAASPPAAVRAVPAAASAPAPGVQTTRRMPSSHNAPFFAQRHGAQASARPQTCMSCHERTQCEQCHNAVDSEITTLRSYESTKARNLEITKPRSSTAYHPTNFLQRHASAAYGRNLECSNCHETARFCRACHEQAGMGTSGARMQPGFHDARGSWLLNHGKPARQGLESCASCHKQTDCMQCHSQLGAFRISPHGPGFDPRRAQSKNARVCLRCHLGDPLGRNGQ